MLASHQVAGRDPATGFLRPDEMPIGNHDGTRLAVGFDGNLGTHVLVIVDDRADRLALLALAVSGLVESATPSAISLIVPTAGR